MLRDAAPEARLEVSLLVVAVEEGVGQRLARSSGGLLGGEIERLAGDLVARRGLSPGNADWAVRTLSWAVGRSPCPAPLGVGPVDTGHGHPGNGPGGALPGGGWELPRSDRAGVPESWVIGGGSVPGGRGPEVGGGGGTPDDVPLVWWQRVPVIAGIAGAILLGLAVVVVIVLGQRSGSADPTAGGGTGTGTGTGTATDPGSGTEPGSGTASGSGAAGTGAYPDDQEQGLLALLPAEYTADSVCERFTDTPDSPLLMHRPLATLTCTPAGGDPAPPDAVVFVRYASDTESEMTFGIFFPEIAGGDCVPDAPMATTYYQGDAAAGHVGCQIGDDGTAFVEWTRTGRGIFAYGQSATGRLDALYTWFLSSRAFIE
jgi:hypothetical protein